MNNTPIHSYMTSRLSLMMFLQFFAWGAWFATLGLVLTDNQLGAFVGLAYGTAPLAAIFAPLFLGLIADRLFPSQHIFGTLMLIGGLIMLLAIPTVASSANQFAQQLYSQMEGAKEFSNQDDLAKAFETRQLAENSSGHTMRWLILAYMLCYMPTLGLGNTIAFTHIPSQDRFPLIRVWGTIGWIVAGLIIGGLAWDNTFNVFRLGGICSILLGIYCFTLPNTPPPLKGQPMDLRAILMVDAFKLLKDWNFLIFAICSTLVCIPLAFYYGSTSQFLGQTGFKAPAATMTLGQMSEIFFMLLVPFFFRHLGVKKMISIGIGCWVIRYVLFAVGAPDQIVWMLLLGIVLHGICYDFFFVTGFMYTDQKAPQEIRGQAQGLLVFLTQGIGMFFGYLIMDKGKLFNYFSMDIRFGEIGEKVTKGEALAKSIAAATPQQESSFFQRTFGEMFTQKIPDRVDAGLLGETMQQWYNFWMLPAVLASGVFVIFFLLFWDKTPAKKIDP